VSLLEPEGRKMLAADPDHWRGAVIHQSYPRSLQESNGDGVEELQDPYGIRFWPEFKGRDGARIPMVWATDNASGGFSTGKPLLPVKAPHLVRSVAALGNDPGSILAHYRRALAFRRAHPALRTGTMEDIRAAEGAVSFLRLGEEEIFCAFKLGEGLVELALPEGEWATIGNDLGAQVLGVGRVTLGPWAISLARRR
jgi:alpha-glucosidase